MSAGNMIRAILALLLALPGFGVFADGLNIANLRGGVSIDSEPEPPRMAAVVNDDLKRRRNYPMQPPTIPHKIDGYVVDLNSNKCMSCHSRRRIEDSQAPMVSVTHYMDRDGNFLAEVSPRRYFCQQCHVAQAEVKPLVGTTFEDVDSIIRADSDASSKTQ